MLMLSFIILQDYKKLLHACFVLSAPCSLQNQKPFICPIVGEFTAVQGKGTCETSRPLLHICGRLV